MTTRVLLIRHGAHDLLGRVLCGRMDGVVLNPAGLAQAAALGAALAGTGLTALHASPSTRAQQTAAPIAAACGVPVQTQDALDEIDTGDWTGVSFHALAQDPGWARWNTDRLHHRPPGGESMLQAQLRIAAWLQTAGQAAGDRTIAAITHADLIKAACCHALGLSVDFHARFDIDPASITTLSIGDWGMKLDRLNQLA